MPVSVFSIIISIFSYWNILIHLIDFVCIFNLKKKSFCVICKVDFSFATNLNRHIRRDHKKLVRKFECNLCKLQCATKYSFKLHSKRQHEGLAACTICWQGFYKHFNPMKKDMFLSRVCLYLCIVCFFVVPENPTFLEANPKSIKPKKPNIFLEEGSNVSQSADEYIDVEYLDDEYVTY